jgi:hypothetical protein
LIRPLLFLAILLALSSCGKKGPPFLPRKSFPARVVDLRAEWSEGYVLLKGNIAGLKGPSKAAEQVKGCRVFFAQYPLGRPPCEGCPIEYQGSRAFGEGVVTEEGFSCKLPAKVKGQIYFFEVRLVGPEGAVGPPSDMVKVIAE